MAVENALACAQDGCKMWLNDSGFPTQSFHLPAESQLKHINKRVIWTSTQKWLFCRDPPPTLSIDTEMVILTAVNVFNFETPSNAAVYQISHTQAKIRLFFKKLLDKNHLTFRSWSHIEFHAALRASNPRTTWHVCCFYDDSPILCTPWQNNPTTKMAPAHKPCCHELIPGLKMATPGCMSFTHQLSIPSTTRSPCPLLSSWANNCEFVQIWQAAKTLHTCENVQFHIYAKLQAYPARETPLWWYYNGIKGVVVASSW